MMVVCEVSSDLIKRFGYGYQALNAGKFKEKWIHTILATFATKQSVLKCFNNVSFESS